MALFNKKSPLKVLLVEDDRIVQLAHKNYLLELGCEVNPATTGTEAVNKAKQPFDIILMDIGLPELNGIEATIQIREQEKTTQHRATIIALTGYADAHTHQACLASGMDDIWVKPLRKEDFKNRFIFYAQQLSLE